MDLDEIIAVVDSWDGVLTLRPGPGDGTPEIAWGDVFFYHAPDGEVPTSQPFATVVTKDYPDEPAWHHGRPGRFRVNVAAGSEEFRRWTGAGAPDPGRAPGGPEEADVITAHPTYGSLGWLCVVDPGPRTGPAIRDLLRTAYELARQRHQRRAGTRADAGDDPAS